MNEKSDGYLVSKETLRRYDESADRVLGNGGQSPNQINGLEKYLRKPKFVKTPSGGITTTDPTQPGSATCKVMEWNGDWSQLTENTDIEETVYSLVSIAGDTIVEVKPVAGRLFATSPGGAVDISEITYQGNTYATTTWTRQNIATGQTTNSSIFTTHSSGATNGNIEIQKGGIYQLYFPTNISNRRRSVTSSYQFYDQTSMVNIPFTEYRGSQETIELIMYVTESENTTKPTSGQVTRAKCSAQESGMFAYSVPHQFQIETPLSCVFSVDEDDAPFELQLWTQSDVATAASENTVTQFDAGYLIRHPDYFSTGTTPFTASPPP